MTHLVPNPPALEGTRFERDAVLGPRTTYKVGGPADLLVHVETQAALPALLTWLKAAGTPFFVLGNGSNLLVSDDGYRGCVITLGDAFRMVATESSGDNIHIRAGAAASITRLLRHARSESLGGLEILGGIPGTVGGAVRMNAGTRWGETADMLVRATIADATGRRDLPASELGLAYRHAALPDGAIVIEAVFRAIAANEEDLAKYDEVLAYRKSTQPLQYPSCGSVFANPPGDAAGRLIEAAGLKGHTIGGAQIAPQHANWIINLGDATANDVFALMTLARTTVAHRFGIELRPEVRLIGDFRTPRSDGGGS